MAASSSRRHAGGDDLGDPRYTTIGDSTHLYGHSHHHWRVTPVDGVDREETWAWPEVERPSGHEDYLRQVYAALAADQPLPSVASAPSRAMEIVTAMYASAREGGGEVSRLRLVAQKDLRGALSAEAVDLRATGDPAL